MKKVICLRLAALAAAVLLLLAPATQFRSASVHAAGTTTHLFITSAVEFPGNVVELPLHEGLSGGKVVYFVVTEASDSSTAALMGINYAQHLANAAGTAAVQNVTIDANGMINFPATVNFHPTPGFSVVAGPTGFPPKSASPPAVGNAGYSPLIEMPDGVVMNAPQVANSTGHANKVLFIDRIHNMVMYRETNGFQGGKALRYASFDASDPGAAALEHDTYAPALNNAPSAGCDDPGPAPGANCSRAALAAFTNGQTGRLNPNRQGLNSAILDGMDPLNVLRWNPSQGRYSPLWDVHLTQWQVPVSQRIRQTDYGQVVNLANQGKVVGFNGTPQGTAFGPTGFIVNCPIISQQT